MKTILFLNKLDPQAISLAEALREKGEEVDAVLIQDAVYLALRGGRYSADVERAAENGVRFYLLENDVEKRGIRHKLTADPELVDYDALVELLLREDRRVLNL